MISALLVIFLLICISIVCFIAIACCLLAEGFGVVAESSTSLLSTAYFVLLFTTTFDSGQRLFLLFAFSVAVHFKQHSSLTYQNPFYKITDLGCARQQDNESTRQLVGRQPLAVSWSCRLVVCEAQPTFVFCPLPFVFRRQSLVCEAIAKYKKLLRTFVG